MKVMLGVLSLAVLVFAREVKLREGITPKKLSAIKLPPEALPRISWDEIRSILFTKGELKAGFIQADVTDYALKVISHIDKFIVENGLDPLELSNETFNLIPTGNIKLNHGWLQELSHLNISDSVIAQYSTSTKIVELTLPLTFDALLVTYDYDTHIVLLDITGTVDAKIENVKLNLHMGFNFTSFYAFVDKADVRDTGKITIKLTGLGLLDWIIDLIDGVLITFFHGLILDVVNLIVQNPVDDVVGAVNDLIDGILHRNHTELRF